ncbi:MAG: MATE family efflux transporter [Oscillospiraceae bacterium]|nr:MATE family efflux transporter [Oscillospiraceae bacterium]
MVNIARRFFSVNHMLKPNQYTNDTLPKSKEVYAITMKTAYPSIIETFLIGLMSLASNIMVGALGGTVGDNAIAAVGITGQPRMVLFACVFSLNVGVTAVVARRKGEEDRVKANETLSQSLVICFIIVILMAIIGNTYAKPLMLLAGAKENTQILDFAVQYFQITSIGFIFSSLAMVMNAGQRGVGNTKISMVSNLTADTTSLIFNYLLIDGNLGFPRFGVRGAAISVLIGNIVGFSMCLINLTVAAKEDRFLKLRFKLSNFKLRAETLKSVANVSLSALVEQVCMRIGFFTYARLVAGLDTPTIPALTTYTVCMNIQNMSFTFGDGLNIATSSLVGRSLGAKRPDMAIVYGKTSQRIGLVIASVLMCVFFFGRYHLIGLFTHTDKVLQMGGVIMLLIAFACPFQICQVVFNGSLRGAGDTKFVAVTSFISITFVRPILTWIFCYPIGWGLTGAWLSLVADQMMRFSLSFWRFSKGEWTKKKV